MTGIYELTLRAADGRERRIIAWLPTEACQQDFYDKARKRGLTVIETNDNELNEFHE